MATTYTRPKPDADVHDVLSEAIDRWHPELAAAEVTIGVEFAWPSERGDHALKLHGYPAAAVVAITPYRQRVRGVEDAVITIDGPAWKDFSDAEKLALVDHEAVHLELVRDEDGYVKSDDHGRPKLKMRLHDWNLSGFRVIAERHGPAALESQMFRDAHRKFYQAVFSWSDDQAPQDEAPDAGLGSAQDAEAAGVPRDATGWREVTVGDLGLAEKTVELLDEQAIATTGELVAVVHLGTGWMGTAAALDVDDVLGRFRNGLVGDELADFDAARQPQAGEPKRGRKTRATA
jgi:hypothetical protein